MQTFCDKILYWWVTCGRVEQLKIVSKTVATLKQHFILIFKNNQIFESTNNNALQWNSSILVYYYYYYYSACEKVKKRKEERNILQKLCKCKRAQ